jgi:hypothetical protein
MAEKMQPVGQKSQSETGSLTMTGTRPVKDASAGTVISDDKLPDALKKPIWMNA